MSCPPKNVTYETGMEMDDDMEICPPVVVDTVPSQEGIELLPINTVIVPPVAVVGDVIAS